MLDITRIFSLKSQATFFLLVAALCLFSIGAWWAVSLLVWSGVEARLRSGTDRIEASIGDQFAAQGNNLTYLKAHFLMHGVPNGRGFQDLMAKLDTFSRYPGLRGVGYAKLTRAAEGMIAPLSLIEPLDWRNKKALGADLLADPVRREAIELAARKGDVALSDPLDLAPGGKGKSQKGFVLFLPLAKKEGGSGLSGVSGVIYAPLVAADFFESVFGAPSLGRESLNFVITTRDRGEGRLELYNRFGLSADDARSWTVVERPISLFGRELTLQVYPLEHFYSFADRYLALIVGLGAALVACMVMIVLRVSQNQLEFETLAKESSMEAARVSRRQLENLRRLNEFDRMLSGELDADELIKKFSAALSKLTEVESAFLYFKKASASPSLHLRESHGIAPAAFRVEALPEAQLEKLATQSLLLRRGMPGAAEALQMILVDEQRYSDWFLSVVSTREGGRCGLVFAARAGGRRFSEIDKELFESMVTQFASGMEIAQLFLRVEDASKAKNAFLANMSHEIRTPLSAIIGFSEMVTKADFSPPQRAALAENLRKNGEQLTCIIDDILDLSKVEAGKLKIERAPVALSPVIHELRSVMVPRAEQKNIRFSIETAGKVPAKITTDEVRLKQILMNIVGNGIKFTERGGVSLIVRHLQGDAGRGGIAFTVKDTGVGISDDAQKDLFRPFSQGDVSSTRRFGGSGLGLALSRRLAQELGGDVKLLHSICGQGSTFEIRIDAGRLDEVTWLDSLAPRPVAVSEPRPSVKGRLAGVKLMVVEDSEDNQDIFRYFLEGAGAETELVTNGNAAVETAAKEDFDIILMDIQIPGIDGKEATRRIRRQGFTRPIVALTAHAMPEEQQSCLKAGCDGQITKPVSGEALVVQVAGFLGRM